MNDKATKTDPVTPSEKQVGFLGNLLFNIVIPVFILTRLSGDEYLGPFWGMFLAVLFPVSFGLYEMSLTRKFNGFSILGIVSVMLTGTISLLELDLKYIAIKEAAIPAFIGIAVISTHRTRFSVVKLLFLNDKVFHVDKIMDRLTALGNHLEFDRQMSRANYFIACSFFVSSALNYILAKKVVLSPTGTEAHAAEIGKMTLLSYPVIVLPVMIIFLCIVWFLFHQLKKLTQMPLDELLVNKMD